MSSGGITGSPVVIDGKTGKTPGPATTTERNESQYIISPRTGRRTFARWLTIRNFESAGGANLLVRVNGEDQFSVKADEAFDMEGIVSVLTVEAASGTVQYEAVLTVA